MQVLDLSSADAKVLADIQGRLAALARVIASPVATIAQGIDVLATLRRESYEDINQIQHEYAALCAVRWLIAEGHAPSQIEWRWNPRQTGRADEPDIRGLLNGRVVLSGEVTTSTVPQGKIDERMAATLGKLATMDGRRFYFVLSPAMEKRAQGKVAKAGYELTVVHLTRSLNLAGQSASAETARYADVNGECSQARACVMSESRRDPNVRGWRIRDLGRWRTWGSWRTFGWSAPDPLSNC